jgi:hypothetical protein
MRFRIARLAFHLRRHWSWAQSPAGPDGRRAALPRAALLRARGAPSSVRPRLGRGALLGRAARFPLRRALSTTPRAFCRCGLALESGAAWEYDS